MAEGDPYFDPGSNDDDRNRLNPSIRDHPELSNVAKYAEEDLIDRFTVVPADTVEGFFETETDTDVFVVAIYGYESDPDEAKAETKARIKKAVARIVEHRLRHIDEDDSIESESMVDYSMERKAGFSTDWPDNWYTPLAKLDLREPTYSL